MPKYCIFDLNCKIAFLDEAVDQRDAIRKLCASDESYADLDVTEVYRLDDDEAQQLLAWIDGGQKTSEWPLTWRVIAREDSMPEVP